MISRHWSIYSNHFSSSVRGLIQHYVSIMSLVSEMVKYFHFYEARNDISGWFHRGTLNNDIRISENSSVGVGDRKLFNRPQS